MRERAFTVSGTPCAAQVVTDGVVMRGQNRKYFVPHAMVQRHAVQQDNGRSFHFRLDIQRNTVQFNSVVQPDSPYWQKAFI
jgi:hypothetical protein